VKELLEADSERQRQRYLRRETRRSEKVALDGIIAMASSLRPSISLTSSGKTAPSELLHKQLDITPGFFWLDFGRLV
jgi:hypothetical protein